MSKLTKVKANLYIKKIYTGIKLKLSALGNYYLKFEQELKKYIIRFLLILLAFGIVYNLYIDLSTDTYMVNSFKVQDDIQKTGMSGDVFASEIIEKATELKAIGNSIKEDNLNFTETATIPEIQIQGISLQAVLSYIKLVFGVQQKSISGRVVMVGNTLRLTLIISGQPVFSVKRMIKDKITDEDIRFVIEKAAEQLLRFTDPYLLACYFESIGANENAINTLRYSLQNDPDNRVWAYNLWGNISMKNGEYDDAINKYQKAISLDSQFSKAFYGIGNCLGYQSKFDEAYQQFRKAELIDPDDVNLWNSWGFVLSEQQQFDKAIEMFNKALALQPDNVYALYTLASIYSDLQKNEDALKIYHLLTEVNPTNINGWIGLGYCYQVKKEYENSIKTLEKALEVDSLNNIAYGTLAETYGLMNKTDKFYQNLDSSLKYGYEPYVYFEEEPYKSFSGTKSFAEIIKKYKK